LEKQKTILICPLNWGIGHASRCIPIIRCLNHMGHRVVIAADNKPLALLQSVFPDNQFVRFPGYEPTYNKGTSLVLKMITDAPGILRSFRNDQIMLDKIIQQHKVDGLISDNRFGASSSKISSVFITHQLFIQTPNFLNFTKPIINYLNFKYIRKFNEVWIPDFKQEPTLSGRLSHGRVSNMNIHYIGPLSRFSQTDVTQFEEKDKQIDLLVLLSGPEPQRSILEKLIVQQLKNSTFKAMIIRGLPGETNAPACSDNLLMKNHVNQDEFLQSITQARYIVARAGYSTIMDLVALHQKAILIPTPGQTEQEYLAKHLNDFGQFYFVNQDKFNLLNIEVSWFNEPKITNATSDLLSQRIQSWVSAL
jgi:uncharacterized protein (TIGR00661 family)